MRYIECKECGCKLWSDYSKTCGLCPECKDVDRESNKDLEDQLNELIGG